MNSLMMIKALAFLLVLLVASPCLGFTIPNARSNHLSAVQKQRVQNKWAVYSDKAGGDDNEGKPTNVANSPIDKVLDLAMLPGIALAGVVLFVTSPILKLVAYPFSKGKKE